jgi:hypothetical protein
MCRLFLKPAFFFITDPASSSRRPKDPVYLDKRSVPTYLTINHDLQ